MLVSASLLPGIVKLDKLVSASLLPGIVKLDNVGKCQFVARHC